MLMLDYRRLKSVFRLRCGATPRLRIQYKVVQCFHKSGMPALNNHFERSASSVGRNGINRNGTKGITIWSKHLEGGGWGLVSVFFLTSYLISKLILVGLRVCTWCMQTVHCVWSFYDKKITSLTSQQHRSDI